MENVIVKIPELEILKQYYHDAYSWRCQLHGVLQGIIEQEDHGNIVRELSCILEGGKLLKIRGCCSLLCWVQANIFSRELKLLGIYVLYF